VLFLRAAWQCWSSVRVHVAVIFGLNGQFGQDAQSNLEAAPFESAGRIALKTAHTVSAKYGTQPSVSLNPREQFAEMIVLEATTKPNLYFVLNPAICAMEP